MEGLLLSASPAGGHAIVHILVLASHPALMTPADRHPALTEQVKLNKNNLLPRNVGCWLGSQILSQNIQPEWATLIPPDTRL